MSINNRKRALLSRTKDMASRDRYAKFNPVQGCKCQSLIEDCSKANRTTYDKIFTVDSLGSIAFRSPVTRSLKVKGVRVIGVD